MIYRINKEFEEINFQNPADAGFFIWITLKGAFQEDVAIVI